MTDQNRGDDEEGQSHTDYLHGAFTWEPRTRVDRFLVNASEVAASNLKIVAVTAVLLITINSVSLAALGLILHPLVGVFTLASVVPAGFVAIYLWESEPMQKRPAVVLLMAFFAGHVVVAVAYFMNTYALDRFEMLPWLSLVFFFMLFVGPVEEGLKLAAVYLNPFRARFLRTPMDGMVFGAFTGLGFATAENALYVVTEGILGGGGVETLIGRAGIAPAHVMWTSISGYYLGLAFTNKRYVVPIVLKGLVAVALLHGVYNVSVSYLPAGAILLRRDDIVVQAVNVLFLAAFYGLLWYIMESLVRKYRHAVSKEGLESGL